MTCVTKKMLCVIILLCIALPSVAYAEVSDKLPSLAIMSFFSAMTAAFLFFSYKVNWWFPFALTPLTLFFLLKVEDAVTDTHFTEAATIETDGLYTALLGLGVLAVIVCHGVGLWRGWQLRNKQTEDA